jgi:tRNA(Arg) A34 adenosine deaminase TadA
MNERHLRRAIELAANARAEGEMPYGSLLVGPDGAVLAEDHNTVRSSGDITAHPELKLARWAAQHLDAETAKQTTMYTSTQPCPMCTGAIARSGLGCVVFALATDEHNQITGKPGPDARPVTYDGPHLLDQAGVPIDGFYD